MTYQINDKTHGFTVANIYEVPGITGTLYEFSHDVTGARLFYYQTTDSNKLFSAAFKTIPADSTGVFHILEHSMLSGSEKYPLREPFVELLKNSMNTFLNALTFADKTLYPVSSRNEKDFHNLMGVYLDAVFAPKVLENPNIFYQEGWHYELNEEMETPVYKGVVFNEMKGAESSLDTQSRNALKKMLFGDTCYGFISGGDVSRIPDLTYEQFCETYRRYYHPTNAVFYLEGNMDFEQSIADLASYLDRFEGPGPKFTIPIVEELPASSQVRYYDCQDVDENGNMPPRTRILWGRLFGTFKDREMAAAAELLTDYLTGSNEAPLTKALLSSGMAEDLTMGLTGGIKQPYFTVSAVNCRYEDRDKIEKLVFDTVKELAAAGLNRHELSASLNAMEFSYREEQEPRALYHNIQVLDSSMYGGDPAEFLETLPVFAFLREKLETDYYEQLLLSLFDREKMQTLYMLPSTGEEEKKRQLEKERLEKTAASWSPKEREQILDLNRRLLHWQQTPDTPEVLATIPRLQLEDVDPNPPVHAMKVENYRGTTILHHGEGTRGIVYLNLYFPIATRKRDELLTLSLLPMLEGNLSTADRGPLDFQVDCEEHLGDLSYDIVCDSKAGETESCQIHFEVSIAALNEQAEEGLRLAREVIFTSRLDEMDLIRRKLMQKVESARRGIISSGHGAAMGYTEAAENCEAAAEEILGGLTNYRYLKDLAEHFEEKMPAEMAKLDRLRREIFRAENMIISITSPDCEDEVIQADHWIDGFSGNSWTGNPAAADPANGEEKGKEGIDLRMPEIPQKTAIIIPSRVSYAVMRSGLERLSSVYSAKWKLLPNILRYNYLWDKIRVEGGAYGCGMTVNNRQALGFYSYRDPDPVRSLKVYDGIAGFLKRYIEEQDNLDGAIISTISGMEPLLPPDEIGDYYDELWMRESAYEKRKEFRGKLLKVLPEDLEECRQALEAMQQDRRICVVGSGDVCRSLEKEGFVVSTL